MVRISTIEKCIKIRVWWCQEWMSWGVTWYGIPDCYGAEDMQIGESEWYASKSEAVDMARAYRDSGRCETLEIGTRR